MKMKKILLLQTFMLSVFFFTSCEFEQKMAVKKILKETHEKELRGAVKQLEKNIEEAKSLNKYEDYELVGKSEEWNEKIQPLLNQISEHHKNYHGENSIIDNEEALQNWTYFLEKTPDLRTVKSEISDKLYTCCPFCADYWKLGTMYEYDVKKTSFYEEEISRRIIKESFEKLHEDEFRATLTEMKNFFENGKVFNFSEYGDTWSFSDSYYKIFNKFGDLHKKYHNFYSDQYKELLSLYINQTKVRRKIDTDNPLPVISEDYTCCPWCRFYADCEIEGKSTDRYSIQDLPFLWEIGMANKWETERSAYLSEVQKKYEAEALDYLKVSPSDSIKGKLYVELKNNKKCPEILYIPEKIDGIEVGDVYIREADNLKAAYLPKTVEIAGFPMCHNLEKAFLNDGLQTIYFCGFLNCYSLKEISIPNSVSVIGDFAFTNCVSLEKVNLPTSLVYIGAKVFGFHWDESYDFGPKKKIVRKKLDLEIPSELQPNKIVFGKKNFSNSFKIWFFAFTNTEEYLPLSTQVRLRELGYTGKFNGEPEDAAM